METIRCPSSHKHKQNPKFFYFGYTGNLVKRVDGLGVLSADLCKCKAAGPPPIPVILADNTKTRQVALLIELHLSAKAILARPSHVRVGPWLTVRPLSVADMGGVRRVADCQTLRELSQYVATLPEDNRLSQHVRNVRFDSNVAPSATTVPLPQV